jgi:hypothetical protein
MLGFNQDEYLTSAREIIAARKQAETVADDIYDSGCSALFFASVGGSLAPMMAINEFAKELTSVPVYLEQAAELIHRGHKKLNKEPLPEKFDLVITAKAYGPNANKPIPVRVGESEQVLTLDNDVTTTTLHFDNPTRSNTLIITPPDPQTTNEGNILGHSPRQLGIGMVEIKVVKSEG